MSLITQEKIQEYDLESGKGANADVIFKDLDFTEKTIRQGFIRKVYIILMTQLSVTLGFVSVFMFVEPVKDFVRSEALIFAMVASLVICVVILIIFCSKEARRRAPGNYIFLGIFTVAMSFFVGVITATSRKDEVFMALGLCTVVCVALTIFAFQTKIDFTLFNSGLCALLTILTMVSVSVWVFYLTQPELLYKTRLLQLCLAGLGAFVFSLLLVYHTQLIIGGNHKLTISPEEYVFAALTLYMDIISMFLRILRMIRVF